MLRVRRLGGQIAVAVWNSLDRTPAHGDQVAMLGRPAGSRAAGALRALFVLGDRTRWSGCWPPPASMSSQSARNRA